MTVKAMKRLLVLQHVQHEILGTLNPLLKRAGFRIRYVNFARHPDAQPKLDGYDGLVVLGGPMGVYDTARFPHLNTELRLIDEAIGRDIPVLGICLGSQLIAKALGARVFKNGHKEIGWYDISPTADSAEDPLFSEFAPEEKIFQWHGDTFDMPTGAIHLAYSELCMHQAFRYDKTVYGFQFHLEVDERMIHRWLRVTENRIEVHDLHGRDGNEDINRQTTIHIDRLQQLAEQVFGEFINLFGVEKKYRRLPSR